MSGSPFSPLSRTKMKRRLFSGTTAELRSEIKSILKNRHTGDVDAMVNIVTGAIVKEIGLRAAMETSGISLDLLLAAYSFCGRQIALDKVEIVDLNSTVGFMANNGVESMVNGAAAGDGKVSQSNFDEFAAEEQKPTCSTSNKNLDSLDAIGGRLMSAFGGAVDKEEEQFKAVIDYVVEVGYKRAKEDQNRLKSCLEEVLIDGISVQGALAEFPSLRRVVALEYSQRCQKVHKFLLLNVRDLLEKIGAEKQKKQKGPLTLADVLSESDVGLLKSFLKDLQKLNCAATPELVRHLAKRAVSAKSGASFKWTPAIDESLLATGIMAADGFAEE